MGDDPTNGEGFESALAHALAGHLGYVREEVRWVRVPSNGALEPGPKMFDVNLSQFSPASRVRSIGDLKRIQLGVQVGTTSYTAASSVGGDVRVEIYNTNADAKLALGNGEIDWLVADLPTAFAVAGEICRWADRGATACR